MRTNSWFMEMRGPDDADGIYLHGPGATCSYTLAGPSAGNLNNGDETVELRRPDPPQTTPGPSFGLICTLAAGS